jgi:hypothetical protein
MTREKVCTDSVQTKLLLKNIFDLELVESVDVVLANIKAD